MIPTLAIAIDSPLMQMFGFIAAGFAGAVGGYLLGTNLGSTGKSPPLAATVRRARERLASAATSLEKASAKLTSSGSSDLAGTPLVLSRRITEASAALGTVEHKTKRGREGSA